MRDDNFNLILDKIHEWMLSLGDCIQPPADLTSLKDLQDIALEKYAIDIPKDLHQFLCITDGIEWNGAVFYAALSGECSLTTISEMIFSYQQIPNLLPVGHIEDQYFYYNHKTATYEAYRVGDRIPYLSFASFTELFEHAMVGRVPV